MLSVASKSFMLNVILLSVVRLSVVMLSVIMPSVFMLSVFMLSVIMLSVVILEKAKINSFKQLNREDKLSETFTPVSLVFYANDFNYDGSQFE